MIDERHRGGGALMERKPTAAAAAIGLPSEAEIAQVALDPEFFSYMLEEIWPRWWRLPAASAPASSRRRS